MSVHTKRSDTHEEMYIHITPGVIREEYGERIADVLPWNGATFFFRKEGKEQFRPDGGVWKWSLAFCSPEDQFDRRIGRNVARRRYFNYHYETFGPNKPKFDDAIKMFEDLARLRMGIE
jgi:hypothetical protein